MRILFVHGTGVRRARFDDVFGLVRRELERRLPDAAVAPCFWGEEHGAWLAHGGQSIPPRPGVRGIDGEFAVTPLDEEVAEWALLQVDPLCELRVLAALGGEGEGQWVPGAQGEGALLAERFGEMTLDDELTVLLDATALTEHYPAAQESVAAAAEFADACEVAEDAAAAREVATATARALVASMLATAGDAALCTGSERDRVVDLLIDRLGGGARMPGDRVRAVLGKLALRLTTQPALDYWRRSITTKVVPPLGDILRYQARGGPLREFLQRQVGPAEPVVVLAHSLGGIAMVDLLAMAGPGQVRLLVTVGSQAPFLHELGALTSLNPGARLPESFPRWLNIFDRQDLLSFRAAPIFPDDARVRDLEVSSGEPFPVSHSAYWKNAEVYDEIVATVKALE
ncbi:hypothetical protein [Nocardia sp. NPDC051832]|uniref:hypothetical protein n=1 Tax=Nocardia sp. NPDC051832 TaxID=3155673 RepID=UPI00343607F1